MYVVGIVSRRDRALLLQPVWCQQPGGCTRAELPREILRALRSAAACQHGGLPHDYTVAGVVGHYSSQQAAEELVDNLRLERIVK